MINEVVDALQKYDQRRPRALQRRLGPSAVGGCRRQAWLRLHDAQETNPGVFRLAAVMGTAIHTVIEEALQHADPFRYRTEIEVEANGVLGHIDCYDQDTETVWDWKTITKKKAAAFPTRAQVRQVQMYGAMLEATGVPVKRVGLVGLCRDGSEADVVEWSADFDPEVAREGFDWIAEVESAQEAPEPEMDAVSFCSNYCEFYSASGDGCSGKPVAVEMAAISDADALEAVRVYVEARKDSDRATALLDAARANLEGVTGVTPDGVTVKWSERSSSTVDRDAVKAALGEVPMKAGQPSKVLTVKAAS